MAADDVILWCQLISIFYQQDYNSKQFFLKVNKIRKEKGLLKFLETIHG